MTNTIKVEKHSDGWRWAVYSDVSLIGFIGKDNGMWHWWDASDCYLDGQNLSSRKKAADALAWNQRTRKKDR